MSTLYRATCPVAGCFDASLGGPYQTPVFMSETDAARDLADHFTSGHSRALVQTAEVSPTYGDSTG